MGAHTLFGVVCGLRRFFAMLLSLDYASREQRVSVVGCNVPSLKEPANNSPPGPITLAETVPKSTVYRWCNDV